MGPKITTSSLKSSHRSFYLKGMFFKIAQKVNKYLCSFREKSCHQNLSKLPNLVTLEIAKVRQMTLYYKKWFYFKQKYVPIFCYWFCPHKWSLYYRIEQVYLFRLNETQKDKYSVVKRYQFRVLVQRFSSWLPN